tara:strand:+ start:211 stop:1818 length:1608 start_codon:yes stop_codon:yes gene_type:complete
MTITSTPRPEKPSSAMSGMAVMVAVCFALPGFYVIWRFLNSSSRSIDLIFEQRAIEPLWRTVQLAVLVSISSAILGTFLAWACIKTDIPWSRFWKIVVPLPLVFPSFVGAASLLSGLTPGGILHDLLSFFGIELSFRLQGLTGSWFVLTLFTYPYVYLPVAGRIMNLPTSLEESARVLGSKSGKAFFRIITPQLMPSILAGSLLVFLYTLSDFGAVHLMRYETLTQTIFRTRLFDQERSFAMALILLILAFLVITAERKISRKATVFPSAVGRPSMIISLGKWRWPAVAVCFLVVGLALISPLVSMADWGLISQISGRSTRELQLNWGSIINPVWSTLWISVITALIAVAVLLPVAYLQTRYKSPIGDATNALIVTGFAIPGLVIALSLIFWTLHASPFDFLIGSLPLLIFAYIVHFGAQALRTSQIAVSSVPPPLEDAARLLGAKKIRKLTTVDIPIMAPGLAAGAGLVMLSTMKELPATLLASPIGFRTLAVEIWDTYEASYLAETAILSLILVTLSGILSWGFIVRRNSIST